MYFSILFFVWNSQLSNQIGPLANPYFKSVRFSDFGCFYGTMDTQKYWMLVFIDLVYQILVLKTKTWKLVPCS